MAWPRYVTFKGANGHYLIACPIEGRPYLQFSGINHRDPMAVHEVFTNVDGSIRIKSFFFDKFWRNGGNWIFGDADDATIDNADTIFWPHIVAENVVLLQNKGNNNLCKRLTAEGMMNCLNAADSSITNDAMLLVEEPISSRVIRDVQFRLQDAAIRDPYPMRMHSVSVLNNTSTSNNDTLKFSHTNTMTKAWKFGTSLKTGVRYCITAQVPFLADGTIELSAEVQGLYEHGDPEITTSTLEATHQFTVQPMSTVTAKLMAMMGYYDVPFSYTQYDTLFDGRIVTHHKDDGMFTGSNSFNVRIVTE